MNKLFTPQSKVKAAVLAVPETGETTVLVRTEDGNRIWITQEKALELAKFILSNNPHGPVILPASRLVQ